MNVNIVQLDAVFAWMDTQPGFGSSVTPSRDKYTGNLSVTIVSTSPPEKCVLGPFCTLQALDDALDAWLIEKGFGEMMREASLRFRRNNKLFGHFGAACARSVDKAFLNAIESSGEEVPT